MLRYDIKSMARLSWRVPVSYTGLQSLEAGGASDIEPTSPRDS